MNFVTIATRYLTIALLAFGAGTATAQENAHHAIDLTEGEPLLIRQILPSDSRVVRGFTHAPIDGREDTRYSNGVVGEWNGLSGTPAVNYRRFNGNNGLHLTLPKGGFDVVQVRGDWRGRVFLDSDSLVEPEKAAPFCEIPLAKPIAKRVEARRLSFFYEAEQTGALKQVSLFRIETGNAPGAPVELSASRKNGTPLKLIREWKNLDQAIAAITLEFEIAEAKPNTVFTIRVGDVLDARRFATIVDLRVPGPGRYTVTLDIPDQVFLPPESEWKQPPRLDGALVPAPQLRISIGSKTALDAESPALTFESINLTAHTVPRAEALPEAVAWRKLLLCGLFSALSEPRPWMHLVDGQPIREQIETIPAINKYEAAILEVLETAEIARLLAPEDERIVEYHDWLYQNVDKGKPHPAPILTEAPGAPRWAVLVRDNWVEQARIARWWLDHRLTPNGEFGGGPQDDTDLMQVWQCLPMIESEPLGADLKAAGAKLTEILLAHHLEEGLNRRSMDALHAYEEGVNQLALNAWWHYGDPIHFERVMASARSAMKLMVETEDGRLHFVSDRKVGIEEARNGYPEIGESPGTWNWAPIRLMFHPLFVVADHNRNPAVIERYAKWGETWAAYQAPNAFVDKVDIRSGKPAGKAGLPPTANVSPVDKFLALYLLTGDPKWRRPFQMGIDGRGFSGAPIQYGRSIHHLVRWPDPYQDHLCITAEGGYAGFFVNPQRELMLTEWLEKSLSWFQRTRHMNTAAEQKTDRILTYKATVPLSCYLGDAPNRNRWLNLGAVSYEGLRGEDFAALVWDADPRTLRVALYNFTDAELRGQMRVWRLEHGTYPLHIGADRDDNGFIDAIVDEPELLELQRYSAIPLTLPPGEVTVIELEQQKRLDPIRQRADLAVSVTGDNIVRVHNIGSADAEDFRVVLRRGDAIIGSVEISKLEAPLDLHPRSRVVKFGVPMRPGDVIEVDPDARIPEITEQNNRMSVVGGF